MTPVGRIAVGLLLALADFRIGGFDVVPDVVGWVLVVVGLTSLAHRYPGFTTAQRVAVVAAVLSLADLVHPVRTVTEGAEGFRSTTTTTVAPAGLQGVLVSGYLAASVVAAVLLSLALRDVLARHGDSSGARRFGRFAVLHAVFGLLALSAAVAALLLEEDGSITPEGPLAALVLVTVLAALVVQVWFVASVAGLRHRPELQAQQRTSG